MSTRQRFLPGDRIVVNEEGPESYRGKVGEVVDKEGRTHYWVRFEEGGPKPECLLSLWMKPLPDAVAVHAGC